MPPPKSEAGLARAYVERKTVDRFEVEAAAIVGQLGRLAGKAQLLSAVIEIGLNHADEVIELLRHDAAPI